MDIQVDITEDFKRDYLKQDSNTQKVLSEKINMLIGQLRNGCQTRLYRIKGLLFPEGFDSKNSSLYIFRATTKIRLIVSLDDNPLRGNKILTLYKLTNQGNMSYCFMAVAKALYK